MSFDDPSEIERLRLELKKIIAQRDHLLVENRRLTKTSQNKQTPIRVIANELVKESVSSVKGLNRSDPISSLNSESPLAEKIRQFRSYFTDAKMSTQFFGKIRLLLNQVTVRYVKMNGPLACVRSSR